MSTTSEYQLLLLGTTTWNLILSHEESTVDF